MLRAIIKHDDYKNSLCVQVANAARYEVAAAAANIIGTEQPCRVRLRLWHCSADDTTAPLEVPSLTIPDAVLCSEMGVHFSACGRFLAACVACQVCASFLVVSCLADHTYTTCLICWLSSQAPK